MTRRMTIAFWRISVRLNDPEIDKEHNGRESCLLRVMGPYFLTFLVVVNSPLYD